MNLRIVRLILIAGMAGLFSAGVSAQSVGPKLVQHGPWVNGAGEPWWFPETLAKEDSIAAQSLWEAIGDSTGAASANTWSGTYFIGSGTHGSYLRWSTQNGFVLFHVNQCEASVMGFSYGTVELSTGLIKLLPEKTAALSKQHGHGMPTEAALRFVPVIWRHARYLVPENEIENFGDYVAGLGKFNDHNFLFGESTSFFSRVDEHISSAFRREQTQRPLNGNASYFVEPRVPPGYEKFIKRPIDARIVARGKSYVRYNRENEWWNDLIIPVRVNVGSRGGLKRNILLRVRERVGFEGSDEYVKITLVASHTAIGVIERTVRKRPCVKFDLTDDCFNPDYKPIKVGSTVTTNPVREGADSNQ